MKKIALAIVCTLLSLTALAQSANMMALARAELQKRGLTEEEVRTRLIENGIDVDAISPADYPAYQDRVLYILDQMQSEKAAANGDAGAPTQTVIVETGGDGDETGGAPDVSPATAATVAGEVPQTSAGEAAAEAALKDALEQNHVSSTSGDDIYGHALFTGTSMDVFRTTDGAQAPDTYILGIGDEIHISIFGSSQTEIHQRIGADGSIQPTGGTKIFLKGMTLAQARKAIITKLAQHYSFRQDQIAVTISTARTITVSIYGEVGIQGGFTLSALNTAFNALAAAGGPTGIGSIRNIHRSRGDKTDRLDLYQYMKGNIKSVPFDLQNNDVLFVPVAHNIVSIEGAVRRPMRYEMIEGETLLELIDYAGGLTYDVYPDFVQIERRVNNELKYMEYDLDQVMSKKIKVPVEGGDVIRIKTNSRPMENYVSVAGDVYYGGNFDYEPSLIKLLDKAQPRYTARKDFVYIERTSPDETVEVFTVPYPGENGNPDFRLEERDAVTVMAQDSYLEKWTVSVTGEVRNPFSRTFGLNDRMTLRQALEYAGGPTYSARKDYVYVERTRPDQTVEVLTLPFPTDDTPEFQLQTKDIVRVLSLTSFRDVEQITVSGQVRAPFTRTFGVNDRMTVGQAIEYANGLRASVYPVAYIFRRDLTNSAKMQYIPIILEKDGNTLLQPGDELRIYDNSTYTNVGEVSVSGAVKTPVNIAFDSSLTVHDLLTMAGGFEVGAAYDHVEVFRMNISRKDEVTFDMIPLNVDENYYPLDANFQLQPFDHIVVRLTPNFTQGRTVELNGRVKYPGVYVLQDNLTQLSDVIKMAGGLLDDANPYSTLFRTYRGRGSIGINLKDAKRHRHNTRYDPILMEGDVINVVRLENTITIRETGTRMAQYIPEDYVATQKTLVYQGAHSAKWYIKHFAGGFVKTADRNSVTVTMPNNQSESTKRFLWMRFYPTVRPGSVVTLTIDNSKREKLDKPKEKVDWERVAASSLSSLTSIVSMILLIERLN